MKAIVIQGKNNDEIVISLDRIVLVMDSDSFQGNKSYEVGCQVGTTKYSMSLTKEEYERVKFLMLEETAKEDIKTWKAKSSISDLSCTE